MFSNLRKNLLKSANALLPDAAALPGLLIIGAQKAGTSALYNYLTHHPDVYRGRKEVNYFNFNHDQGTGYYKQQFPAGTRLKIDATPSYLYHRDTPARAAALLPDARIIVLLREPVSRAFSAWNMYRKLHAVPKNQADFQRVEAADPSQRLYSEYCQRDFPDFPTAIRRELDWIARGEDIREPSLIRRGFYVEQIERWQEYFSREQFYFISSADLKVEDKARAILKELEEFLGLAGGGFDDLAFKLVHARTYDTRLPDAVRGELENVFRQKNKGLEELTGLSLPWNR